MKRKNTKRQKCYSSGKIGGLNYLEAYENFRKADHEIMALGFIPVNPIIQGLKPSRPYWAHMIADILLLAKCKHIYMQRNWEDSRGAKIEYKVAKFLRLQIWYQENPCCEK